MKKEKKAQNFIRKFFRWLPESWKARIDFKMDKSLGKEFGGPFNGQVHRQRIFRDLIANCEFDTLVETGTFRGITTGFMATVAQKPVYTVEAKPRFFYYARQNLKKLKTVHVSLGDSRKFIKKLSLNTSLSGHRIFFYLDAHWEEDLPLFKEIELIGAAWDQVVIMIDDFEVPGDPGYSYDNYGAGKELSLAYIQPLLKDKWTAFFPSVNSTQETGFKRGSIILASKGLEEKVKELDSLKMHNLIQPERVS